MSDVYLTYEINHKGRLITVDYILDDHSGAPWLECDSHGPVSDWRLKETKRPGEVILHQDHKSYRFYDWQEAIAIAKRDGWGVSPEDMADLKVKLKREPTLGDIADQAVRNDLERLKAWCDDKWHWMGVMLTDVETDERESLWGIESDDDDYIHSVVNELAEQLYLPSVRALICA